MLLVTIAKIQESSRKIQAARKLHVRLALAVRLGSSHAGGCRYDEERLFVQHHFRNAGLLGVARRGSTELSCVSGGSKVQMCEYSQLSSPSALRRPAKQKGLLLHTETRANPQEIDIEHAVIADVEAASTRTYDEVAAIKTIAGRSEKGENEAAWPLRTAAVRGHHNTGRAMSIKALALALASLLLLPLASTGIAQPTEASLTKEVVAVQVRPGVVMNYLGLFGNGKPTAAVVLLAGGRGVLSLGPAGSIGTDLRLNFLIRSREQFARKGFYVAALDAASDREAGMDGAYRLSLQHAREIGHVIAHLKNRLGVPVWLVGTSSSTLSVVNAAARLPMADPMADQRATQLHLPRPEGIVTASSQTVLTPHCGRTVYEASLSAIRVPVLVVSHRDDGCECSPGSAAAGSKLVAALTGTPMKEHRIFIGGLPPVSGPCAARAPHGFFGIEDRVLSSVADWIRAR